MPVIVRIIIVILCTAALFYLVITLGRSATEEETGSRENLRPWLEARLASPPG